ncbi:hypothetical protein H4R34_001084 [Dimargaris verticillata]|uniref:Mss4-like protein n=1 Tax=Dimargaris verticillata TaxID=2761393 RepID=A0A9W8B489_9FUNG|nr:hypothetical protein H4R34_001084 [Dimargaris verticillata]
MVLQVTVAELMQPSNAPRNAHKIHCPRAGCRCLMLRPGVAELVTLTADQAPPTLPAIPTHLLSGCNLTQMATEPPAPSSTPVSASSVPTSALFWRVAQLFDFENSGFLNTDPRTGIKFLSCADCDLAPLGFHNTKDPSPETKAYYLAVDRVRYAPGS